MFRKFAKKHPDYKKKVLSATSFIDAIVTSVVPGELAMEHVEELLQEFGMTRDTLVTKAEFALYTRLLYATDGQFEAAFKSFNGGEATIGEFSEILVPLARKHNVADLPPDAAIFQTYFGDEPKLTYEKFRTKLLAQNIAIVRQTFNYLYGQEGALSIREFKTVVSAAWRRTLFPLVLKVNLKAVSGGNGVDEDQFNVFMDLAGKFNDVSNALDALTQDENVVTKESFDKLVSEQANVSLSEPQKQIIFNIYDKVKEGVITKQTLIDVKRQAAVAGQPLSFLNTLAIGQLSACIGASSVYPIDKVKTRLQSKVGKADHGAIRTLINIARNEGFLHLYKGIGTQLVGITPEKTVKLVVNDYLRRQFKRYNGGRAPTFYQDCLAGVGTGCVQVFITNPYETVKIRIQMQSSKKDKKGAVQIMRELGVRGLYTGFAATVARDLPFNAIYFTLFAGFKKLLEDKDGEVGIYQILASGAGAGGIAAAFDTPADTVKTRLQNGKGKYNGMLDCIQKMYKTEGLYSFFKGTQTRVMVIMPLFAITFTSFEVLQKYFAPGTAV
mmetsp:Transcript_6491/g.7050  ORF Transcript_6491/g.7050 Transcript_6491/m.7050 type:complete len:555 (+) Transcript_6491:198-1862(+)